MTIDNNEIIDRDRFTTTSIEIAIRLTVLAILLYMAFAFISPFITIVIWSAVLSVTLYPTFNFVASRLGDRRRLAAIVTTCFTLLVIVGPAAWLALGLFEGIRSLYERFDISSISLPAPPATIKDWPLIGDHIFQLWTLASTNIQAALGHLAPYLKPLGSGLLRIAADAGTGVLQFLIAIIVAGFLFAPAPSIVHGIKMFSRKLAGSQSDEFVNLAGVTIRAVSRGVIGISALQALLASLGFMAVGVPGTSLITSAVLILGILQIGPSIVVIPVIIWTWLHMDTMAALFFTIYMVPVNLLDNILKPIVMARGLRTPMLVILIGVIGGTLGYGITGLFLGPIVLAVIWELFAAWIKEGESN